MTVFAEDKNENDKLSSSCKVTETRNCDMTTDSINQLTNIPETVTVLTENENESDELSSDLS